MAPRVRYPKVIGLRLTAQAWVKLRKLCKATNRPRADLLRELIARAELSGFPDVSVPKLAPKGPPNGQARPPGTQKK